jgi:uncharacterized protein YraI
VTSETPDPAVAAEPQQPDPAEEATSVPAAEPESPPTPDQTAVPAPTAAPAPSPEPSQPARPALRRKGPATTLTDAALLEWAEGSAPLVFTVPAGSTINLQGDEANGYVHAEFMWMFGWIRADQIDAAARVREERVPEDAEPVDVRTPRAGAGTAWTTVDLSLRAGPSAAEPAVRAVPAGTKVELTGVMQNDFQRVVFRGDVGWIANNYLQLPADPEPVVNDRGRPAWSEREIIKIIEKAADTYGQPREDMLRVARCESALDPNAVNPSGSYGLFQFVRSTWETTPFADKDIFDPRHNANAAGWMWQQGRRSEWVCQ